MFSGVPTLRLADLDLHFEDVGEGSPLVLLHGLGSSGLDWEFQVAHFRDRFRVVTPDLRGHGRSSKPDGAYDVPTCADDLALRIELFDDESREAEKSFDIARSFNFQVRKSQPSESRWLQYTLDRFSLRSISQH